MRKVTMLDESQPGKAIAGKATATSTTGRRTWPNPIWVPKLVRNGVATASEQKTTIFAFLNTIAGVALAIRSDGTNG